MYMNEPNANEFRISLDSLDATNALGMAIGRTLPGGSAVGLVGPLGAGKTHLMKAIAVGNDIADPAEVTSPTFTLVQEYPGRLDLYHIDVYRLRSPAELAALGFDEMFCEDSAVVVEWADRMEPLMPEDTLWIELTPTGLTEREAVLRANGMLSRRCLDGVRRVIR